MLKIWYIIMIGLLWLCAGKTEADFEKNYSLHHEAGPRNYILVYETSACEGE